MQHIKPLVCLLAALAVFSSAKAATVRKAEAKALAIARAACAAKGVNAQRRPEMTVKDNRWYFTWHVGSGLALGVVDSVTWQQKGCVLIGVYSATPPR